MADVVKVWLLLAIVCRDVHLLHCLPVVFNGVNQNFHSIPVLSIPQDVTLINLSSNRIEKVEESPPMFSDLNQAILSYNVLEVFPNLTNWGSKLATLLISSNRIHTIPANRLDPLVVLGKLDISRNKLTQFPDVPGPGGTLLELYLRCNSFVEFPFLTKIGNNLLILNFKNNPLSKASLNKMTYPRNLPRPILYLQETNLHYKIPNLGFWNVQHLDLSGLTFHCDWHIIWLKLLENAGVVVKVDTKPCSSPEEYLPMAWNDITLGDLVCEDLQAGSSFMRVVSDFACSILPIKRVAVPSILQCASMCQRSPGCGVFGFAPISNDVKECVLTGDGPLINITDISQVVWYSQK